MNNTLAFVAFLEKWGDQYASLKNTLSRLKEHQDILDKFGIGEIYSADELDIWVEDWLWLHSKLTHPLDIDYFKPYMVPVQKHTYEFFVDLSEGTNNINELAYISMTPYAWAIAYRFPTLLFLHAPVENLDNVADIFLSEKERTKIDYFNDFLLKNKRLPWESAAKPVTFEEVFETYMDLPANRIIPKPPIDIKDGLIRITDVNVMAVGLLPFETRIERMINVHDLGGTRKEDRIKCVRDLVYYLREHDYKGINELRAGIPETDTEIYYERNCIKITNPSQDLMNRFKLAFEELGNS